MFKIGFLASSSGAVIPDVTPNPVNFDGLLADNTLATPTYQYIAQQITGINVPITLSLKSSLDPLKGHVYYQVAASWPYGTFQDYNGPLSGTYGTFIEVPGALPTSPYNLLTPISFTVNPDDWLILAVDGTVAVASSNSFYGQLYNVDDSTFLSSLNSGSYNLQASIANPVNMDTPPVYDDNNSPDVYYYSSSILIQGVLGTVNIEVSYSDILWDTGAQLYYKVTSSMPGEAALWSSIDPITNGYTAAVSGDKILGVASGKYITFTVGGKLITGNYSANVDLLNPNTTIITSFSATANVI